jgi:hypothetical protein
MIGHTTLLTRRLEHRSHKSANVYQNQLKLTYEGETASWGSPFGLGHWCPFGVGNLTGECPFVPGSLNPSRKTKVVCLVWRRRGELWPQLGDRLTALTKTKESFGPPQLQ